MNEYWEKFSLFVNGKTLRERVIVLLVIVVLVYGLCELLFFGAILDKSNRQTSQMESIAQRNLDAESEVQGLMQSLSGGRQAIAREQQQLNEKLAKVDEELSSAASGFIPATLMPQVLEEILNNSEKLTLIKLENKPVEVVTGVSDADRSAAKNNSKNTNSAVSNNDGGQQVVDADDKTLLYRHGVEMQLQGSYLATLDYLKRLEQLQWRFQWDALSFQVDEYPTGTVTLEVYTYSTERDWLGV